jgi:hypothetical protein
MQRFEARILSTTTSAGAVPIATIRAAHFSIADSLLRNAE